jgi:hypothetical protein
MQNENPVPAVIRELEVFKKHTDNLIPGDRGGAFVRLKTEIELKRGSVETYFFNTNVHRFSRT